MLSVAIVRYSARLCGVGNENATAGFCWIEIRCRGRCQPNRRTTASLDEVFEQRRVVPAGIKKNDLGI